MKQTITLEEMEEVKGLREAMKELPPETKTRIVESMNMFKAGYQFGLADGVAKTADAATTGAAEQPAEHAPGARTEDGMNGTDAPDTGAMKKTA